MSEEFPGVTPQLTVADTDAAVRFYRDVFGADELLRNHGPDGRVMHCELLINGGRPAPRTRRAAAAGRR